MSCGRMFWQNVSRPFLNFKTNVRLHPSHLIGHMSWASWAKCYLCHVTILDKVSFYAVATRIVEEVNLEYHDNKSIDIRKFVKIKKLPGGDITDSCIVDGEVFSGRVMRVGMKQDRAKPKLLLIRDNLSFPRSDKLVSMENLGAQQEE